MDRELENVARRCIWWASPVDALANTRLFLCHVMVYGLWQDVLVVRRRYHEEDLLNALEHAPAGLFDIRSWHYWHHVLGRPVPPLPRRNIPGSIEGVPSSKSDFLETAAAAVREIPQVQAVSSRITSEAYRKSSRL